SCFCIHVYIHSFPTRRSSDLFKLSNLWKGFAMGTTDLVPGVSGGTIALLLGIYDDFIQSVSGIFSKRIWKSLQFLIPIGLGMVIDRKSTRLNSSHVSISYAVF